MDEGLPISYKVLAVGTAVMASDGTSVGTVERVLAVDEVDVFDGLAVNTPAGVRFVDADLVGGITERAVHLTIDAAAAAALPRHESGPPTYDADPADGGWQPGA